MTIKYKIVTEEVKRPVEVVCDKCGIEIVADNIIEYQEVLSIYIFGGYGSLWGDGFEEQIDLCQKCHYGMFKDIVANIDQP